MQRRWRCDVEDESDDREEEATMVEAWVAGRLGTELMSRHGHEGEKASQT
jgi:hypothetical protein